MDKYEDRYEKKKKFLKPKHIVSIVLALISLISTYIANSYKKEASDLKNITQQVNINIVNALGQNGSENTTTEIGIYDNVEMLIESYNSLLSENNELKSSYQSTQNENTSQIEQLSSENQQLKGQIENLKAMLLHTYTAEEITTVINNGFLSEATTKRLDDIEFLDGVNCEQVPTVVDLYGTTHSVSYSMYAHEPAWGKFKLDGKYDIFSANIVTSEDTGRNANMRVEFYVDNVLVSYVDGVVRDENVRPVSFSVNGGNILMIKVIKTNNGSSQRCYITDTSLSILK